MTFVKDISKFIEKVKGKEKRFVTELYQDMMEDIVDGTPVKTGFAKSSWFTGINQVVVKDPTPSGSGPRGGAQYTNFEQIKAENLIGLVKFKPGDTIYLANGAPYIRLLEFPPHYSKQQPNGWIRQIIEKADDYAEAVLQRI